VKWKNFLSTGNHFNEIQLDEHPTVCISGINGSGKSSCIDALTYVLYKKPFRNINLPNLINSINDKEMLVEVEFHIGQRSFLIRRGMKPNIFEIFVDGTLIPPPANIFDYQDNLEKNILKMNYKTFCQIVVLGSANFVPFMLLPAQTRREIIEDLLDIEIFSKMNVLLKDAIGRIKDEISDLEHNEKLLNSRISLIEKHIKEIEINNQAMIEERKNSINELTESIQQLVQKNKEITDEISLLGEKSTASLLDIRSKLEHTKSTQKSLEKKEKSYLGTAEKYRQMDSCPTCQQPIDESRKNELVKVQEEMREKVIEVSEKLSRQASKLTKSLEKATELANQISDKNKEIQKNESSIQANEKSISLLKQQIKDFEKSKKEIDTSDLENHKKVLGKIVVKKEKKVNQRELFVVASQLLKDGGIKTTIIKQYIPIINKLIHKYLDQMDFFCQFEIDENFKEIIRSNYRDDMSYANFSQGERMRIDIALLFTWREIARMRNSSITNLLILDEIMDSSLDQSGTEEFVKIITALSNNSNIFVISHKSEQIIDKFSHVIEFKKDKNFSVMIGA